MPALKWTEELLAEEARKYNTRIEFDRGCNRAYHAALRRGKDFLDSICCHMKSGLIKIWTEDKLFEEARKYKTRWEFNRKNNSAYTMARKRGKEFMDKICAHMEVRQETWCREKIQIEANKFKTRREFQLANVNAYNAAHKHGILNEVCSNMQYGGSGFKIDVGAFLYQFRVVRGRKVYYKVGISNHDPLIRATQFGVKDGVYIERTHAIWFEDGAECRQLEKELHAAAKAEGLQYIGKDLMKSGFTEIFTKPLLH